jgi:hypothetical protein
MIIKNVHVHCIDIFPTIEVILVHFIIPWFLDFEQIIIDETNATWQLLQLCPQGNSFLGCWPLDVMYKCIINAWCNEQCIVTHSIFDQFHMKAPYIMTLWCFMYKMKFRKHWSNINFDDLFKTIRAYLNLTFKPYHKLINLTLKPPTLTSNIKS